MKCGKRLQWNVVVDRSYVKRPRQRRPLTGAFETCAMRSRRLARGGRLDGYVIGVATLKAREPGQTQEAGESPQSGVVTLVWLLLSVSASVVVVEDEPSSRSICGAATPAPPKSSANQS